MAAAEDTTGWRPLAEPQLPVGRAREARTLLDVFAQTVARHPTRIAIDAPDATLTYRELARAAGGLADELRSAGAGPGERVAVRLSSGGSGLYVGILAVLHAGAAYVPIDAEDPPARAQTICEQARVCGILEDDLRFTPLPVVPAGEGQELTVLAAGEGRPAGEDEEPGEQRQPRQPRQPNPGDDAWIIFTSGSTGQPKGVAISHGSAVAFIDGEARLWTVSPEDRVLAGLSVAFDASCEEMWLAWSTGAALVPAPRALVRAGADLGGWLAEREVSVVSTVPTLAAMWDEDARAGVRLLILGGEACPPELGWRLAEDREVWNTYGPTEATVVSTATRIRPQEPITIGWPLHGWQVAVIDEQGKPVPYGEAGELAIAGVGLGRYLDPGLDAERYAPLPALGFERAYRSGDVVRETIEGYEFVGRRDDQVKLGGRRLELGEVQARLCAVPGVRAAAAAVKRTAAGNPVLVGYVVGGHGVEPTQAPLDPSYIRAQLAEHLPDGVSPLIVVLDALPSSRSGKVDRQALPWPPPAGADRASAEAAQLRPAEAWLAERWREQLGPVALGPDTDVFEELGASSIAVAKLVSALRERCPTIAVADVYEHRSIRMLAARMDELGGVSHAPLHSERPRRKLPLRLYAAQLIGLILLTALACTQWVVVVLAYGNLEPDGLPYVPWAWLAGAWLLLCSPLARVAIAMLARRVLLPHGLTPGRYPRNSALMARVWLLERLGEHCRLTRLAGTPYAARYARLLGADVAAGARLASMPTLTSLVHVSTGATVEGEVDMRGWWIDGQELVVDDIWIGADASIGSRTLLMPGARLGEGAEIEPGSVVQGEVPADEHWGGNPARRLGRAGAHWPATAASPAPYARVWRLMFSASLMWEGLLALLALGAAVGVLVWIAAPAPTLGISPAALIGEAGVFVAVSTIVLALGIALTLRAVWRLVRPGWHGDDGAVAWALWFSGELQESAGGALFPLYASVYTRAWLALMGIAVGRRTEISTSTGLTPLVSFGELSQATDDVAFCTARARGGWLHLEPIQVGKRTFLGPGAVLREGTRLGDESLVGALTLPPRESADGSSWFGVPALELPRVAETGERSRTTEPPRRLVLVRGAMDALRILGPNTISVTIGLLDFLVLDLLGSHLGIAVMIALAPFVMLGSGLVSAAVAVALKWIVMGRYRPGQHPLWSLFVWRDELINSTHEQLAGEWLLRFAIGTPLMSAYLRAMGARVGRDVWCETTAVTEFDLVRLDDGVVVNRGACLMTHVFHDRLLRIGSTHLDAGATMGPTSAVLPDTSIGADTCIEAHSVVLRGERLPAGTRWQGSPVTSV
jgi:non-ribosomal peptide synthetase-like protein